MSRTLIKKLWLPFDSIRTMYEGSSEVRLYRNNITGVLQIGKRLTAIGLEAAIVFKEATFLQRVRHDHIVPVHDVAVVDDPEFDRLLRVIEMIMPYYEEGSICDSLRNGRRCSVGEAMRLARETLVGLDEIHERHRLLHRDVKSANVFIDESGRARVGDMGVAVQMEDDGTAEAYATNQLYTPPETLVEQRISRSGDTYGVGLILLELLNGPFPYEEYDPAKVCEKLEAGRVPIRGKHLIPSAHVPPQVRRIVSKAVHLDPSKRFQAARDMIDAIDAAHFVDWHIVSDGPELAWEGTVAAHQGVRYRVVAKKHKRGETWRMYGLRCLNRWQRCISDQIVTDPVGSDGRRFFDQMVTQALSR